MSLRSGLGCLGARDARGKQGRDGTIRFLPTADTPATLRSYLGSLGDMVASWGVGRALPESHGSYPFHWGVV